MSRYKLNRDTIKEDITAYELALLLIEFARQIAGEPPRLNDLPDECKRHLNRGGKKHD